MDTGLGADANEVGEGNILQEKMNMLLNYLADNPDSTGPEVLQHANISPDEVRNFFTVTAQRISQMSDDDLIAYSSCMGDTTLVSRRPGPVPIPPKPKPQPIVPPVPPIIMPDDHPINDM
jgi:hypothetical protein